MPRGPDPILRTTLPGLDLRSPVLLAAGTAGVLDEMADQLDLSRIGGLVTKSITAEAREGNAPWRVWPLGVGMLNSIGLANPGLDAFLADHAPRIPAVPCAMLASIAGHTIDDYLKVAEAFEGIESLRAVELNVSCPNVHGGGDFSSSPEILGDLVGRVRTVLSTTRLSVKLPPVTSPAPNSMTDLARAAVGAGADMLTLCNTTPALSIDVDTRLPVLGNGTGGLSGPAVHAPVVKIVHDVHKAMPGTSIIAVGGVVGWRDAAEFILAGATAVQMGAGLFANPRLPLKIQSGLAKWARAQGVGSISELVGAIEA